MDAANRTVPKGFEQHVSLISHPGNACMRPVSLQGKFLNPGMLRKFRFEVTRLRDGRSYRTRRVDVIQDGKLIYTATMSFQLPEPEQPEYYAPPPIISADGNFDLMREVPDGHSNVPTHVLPPELSIPGDKRMEGPLKSLPKDHKLYPYYMQSKFGQEWLPVEYRYGLRLIAASRSPL